MTRNGPNSRAGSRTGSRTGRVLRGAAVVGVALVVVAIAVGVSRLDVFGAPISELTLPLRHDDTIRQQARDKGVDADLIAAVIFAESRFRDQTSEAGARGLMQITPETADVIERLSGGETFVTEDLADPDLNIRYGTFYLGYLLDRYDGNRVAALAAYNAGPTNVDRWGAAGLEISDIQFEETENYVREVLDKRRDYRGRYAKELGLKPG